MFGRNNRFHGQTGISKVYSSGKAVRGANITLKYTHSSSNKPFRVAVVVSKKVHKSAVTRNRIRRRIYAQVRKFENVIPNGTDLVFTAYNESLAEMPASKLSDNISDLLKKAS
jgi:ribonuclease P protein component